MQLLDEESVRHLEKKERDGPLRIATHHHHGRASIQAGEQQIIVERFEQSAGLRALRFIPPHRSHNFGVVAATATQQGIQEVTQIGVERIVARGTALIQHIVLRVTCVSLPYHASHIEAQAQLEEPEQLRRHNQQLVAAVLAHFATLGERRGNDLATLLREVHCLRNVVQEREQHAVVHGVTRQEDALHIRR